MARKSQAKLHQSDAIGVKLEGEASTSLNLLAGLLREKALRSATYAGAKILYEEMKMRQDANRQSKRKGQLRWGNLPLGTTIINAESQSYVIRRQTKRKPRPTGI